MCWEVPEPAVSVRQEEAAQMDGKEIDVEKEVS